MTTKIAPVRYKTLQYYTAAFSERSRTVLLQFSCYEPEKTLLRCH